MKKILIQGHCSMRAQMAYCKAAFPDWDIRAVLIPQADKWIAEEHPAFLEFLDEIDYFVGLVHHGKLATFVSEATPRIFIPAFSYFGYHPDAVSMPGLGSPLELGAFHSRIVAQAFLEGRSAKEAATRFNGNTYEELGYFDQFEADKARVDERFRTAGIEGLRDMIDVWSADGCFMHFPPHPKVAVFFDVFERAMNSAGLEATTDSKMIKAARDNLDDYLERGLLWPVYPEIAERLNIEPPYADFRLSVEKSSGAWLNFEEFAAKSYDLYKDYSTDQIASMKKFTAVGIPNSTPID